VEQKKALRKLVMRTDNSAVLTRQGAQHSPRYGHAQLNSVVDHPFDYRLVQPLHQVFTLPTVEPHAMCMTF
jgi:hypothetical protein